MDPLRDIQLCTEALKTNFNLEDYEILTSTDRYK
jgi:hypothetical protein